MNNLSKKILSPKVRFKGFNDEWNINYFYEIINKENEKNIDNLNIEVMTISSKYGIIKQKDFFSKNKKIHSTNLKNYYILKKDMFCFNPARINIGSISLYEEINYGLISPLYILFSLKHFVNKIFMKNFIKTNIFHKYVNLNVKGSVRQCLNYNNLQNFKIALPSLNEQNKIAQFFELIDRKIELLDKEKELFEKNKKYYLNNMFCSNDELFPKIRFKGFNENWEIKKIKDIAYVKGNGINKKINLEDIKIILINYMDVYSNKKIEYKDDYMQNTCTDLELKKYKLLYKDILITPSSETKYEIGITSIFNIESKDNYLYSYHLNLIRLNNFEVNSYFLNILFSNNESKRYFYKISQGSSRYTINIGDINKFTFLTSINLEEQNKIAKFFELIDNKIELINKEKDLFKKKKKYYLNNMFCNI